MSDRHKPQPRPLTVEALKASLQGLDPDTVVVFEKPNQEIVPVRSARHGMEPDMFTRALVLKG